MPLFQQETGLTLESNESRLKMTAVRVKNRRREYLDTHPEYLNNPELELAGLSYLFCTIHHNTDRSRISSTMGSPRSPMAKRRRKRSRWQEEGFQRHT